MKRIEESKLNMYEVTRDLLNETETEIIEAMPVMTDYRTNLANNIISITNYGSSQKLNRKGVKDNKEALKDILVTTAAEVSRKVQGYAVNTSNLVLLKKHTKKTTRQHSSNHQQHHLRQSQSQPWCTSTLRNRRPSSSRTQKSNRRLRTIHSKTKNRNHHQKNGNNYTKTTLYNNRRHAKRPNGRTRRNNKRHLSRVLCKLHQQ